MEADDQTIVATSQKRPACEDTAENEAEQTVKADESAAKKLKPASTFSELASRAAAKDTTTAAEAVSFTPGLAPSRSGLPLGFSQKSESTDSDHADSPLSGASQVSRFSNSPSDSRSVPRTMGSFSLAPPTLAAPAQKSGATSEEAGSSSNSQTAPQPFKGSPLIKDNGFGIGSKSIFDKASQSSVASSNPFLQCLQKKSSTPASSGAASSDGEKSDGPPRFVFGQNLSDRAKVPSFSSSASSTNGASTALPAAESASAGGAGASSTSIHDLPIVDVVTGEEGETNILQISCRLYNFNSETRQWVERGRGILRLNDRETSGGHVSSRLVVRSAGSLRVMVNCSLWSGQSCEKVNMKSARLTVMNGSQMEIVLVKASPVEITDVVSKVNRRLNALKNEKKIDKAEPPKFTTAGPGGAANGDKSSPATETVEKETSASEQDTAASAAGQDKGEEVKPVEEEASEQQAAAEEKEAEGNSEAKAEAENSEGV